MAIEIAHDVGRAAIGKRRLGRRLAALTPDGERLVGVAIVLGRRIVGIGIVLGITIPPALAAAQANG